MKFKLKNYKCFKIKNHVKINNFFFIINNSNLNLKEWVELEKTFRNLNFKYYKTKNAIIKKILENSIFLNFKFLIHSSIILIESSDNSILQVHALLNLNAILILVGIKLNKKFYHNIQLKRLHFLKYKTNMIILLNLLKMVLKIFNKLI